MTMKRKYFYCAALLLALFGAACSEDEYAVPQASKEFQNDCIKRSVGPNLVGQNIEFAYAMAFVPDPENGITSARVEASIAGAAATRLENNAYYTNGSGNDVAVLMGEPSVNTDNRTEVIFSKDTCAATLRYFYTIPEEARGQKVKFTFSATDRKGRTVTYPMGPYDISRMDIALDRALSNNNACYISIEDLAVYNAAQAAANPDKIDLVYLYRVVNKTVNGTNTNVFAHGLVSPAADAQYLPGVTLPAGVNRSTKISKAWNLRDFHLARTVASSVYVDDVDLEKVDVSNAPNFAINMKAEGGAWVETADGKYRAYIYVNAVNNSGTMTISMKRLQMF
jgi:hypothetical protein